MRLTISATLTLIRMQLESDEPSPFVEQVMADVERLTAAEQEPEPELESEPKPELKPSWEQKRTKVQTFDTLMPHT